MILLPIQRNVSRRSRAATQHWREAGVEFWPKSGSPRMASTGADRAGSMPKNGYGSCMAMIQPVLCHLNLLEPSRLDVCAALSKRRCFLMMLGSPSKVCDIPVVTSRWQVFSALHAVTRGSVVHIWSWFTKIEDRPLSHDIFDREKLSQLWLK